MRKKASEVKKGDTITIAGKEWKILEIELSDIGKQGTKKVRLVAESAGEKVTIVRPEDYPIDFK